MLRSLFEDVIELSVLAAFLCTIAAVAHAALPV